MTVDHRWPPKDAIAMRTLQAAYGNDREIGKAVNRSKQTVAEQRASLGVPPLKRHRKGAEWPPTDADGMRLLQIRYGNDRQIGETLGRTTASVWEVRTRLGVPALHGIKKTKPVLQSPEDSPAPPPPPEPKPKKQFEYHGADGPPIAYARDPLYLSVDDTEFAARMAGRAYEDDPRPVRNRKL